MGRRKEARFGKGRKREGLVSVANRSALVVFALPICHSRPEQEHAVAS